jgi:uncharacterized membrane protein YdjX (TVP38/TMEM64 family)
MAMSDQDQTNSGLKGLYIFLAIALVGLGIGFFTPLRDTLQYDRVRQFAAELGYWGPVLILGTGLFMPLIFLPRWPVCFVAGLLYGIVWGSLVANLACTLGAWLHYVMSKRLVSESSGRLLKKCRLDPDRIPDDRALMFLFVLRAFPLSNSAATNVLAGALRITTAGFLVSTFLGMIPSTVMYTAWGKLLKKPDAGFYYVALGCFVLIVLGTYAARRFLAAYARR